MYYFSYFLYEKVGTVGGIAHNTQNWIFLSWKPTDGLRRDELGIQPHYEAPGNLQVGHVECVLMTISYHLYFLCISEVLSSYITGQWGKFTVKNATFCFYICFLDVFYQKNCVFIIFISFFLMKYLISTTDY